MLGAHLGVLDPGGQEPALQAELARSRSQPRWARLADRDLQTVWMEKEEPRGRWAAWWRSSGSEV